MNILEQAKHLPHGEKMIQQWVGAGGSVVDPETAQRRANTCLTCPKNGPGSSVIEAVALAIRQYLKFKNHLSLRVKGEKSLQTCQICGCCLRLQIWEPDNLVAAQTTDEEFSQLPSNCWKNWLQNKEHTTYARHD